MEPFVWRKYLDYAAISDAHDIRLRIRDHFKTKIGDITLPQHNMKLGRGGIRDIEFFTQTHQIIFVVEIKVCDRKQLSLPFGQSLIKNGYQKFSKRFD